MKIGKIQINFTANRRTNPDGSFADNKLSAFLDFFFPIKKRIRFEAGTYVNKTPYGIDIYREFGTFRAFLWYCLLNPIWIFRRNAERLALKIGLQKELAFQIGAIAYDTTSDSGAKELADPWTWSHTSTGSNLVMVQDISWFDGGDGSITISADTYNSVALTHQISQNKVSGGTGWKASLYTLASPATGANTVTIDFSAATYGKAGTQTFSGAKTSSPVDVTGAATGTSQNPSKAVTTNNDNSFLVDCYSSCESVDNNDPTPTAGQTANWVNKSASAGRVAGSSRKASTTAGSYTMSWTQAVSDPWATVVIAINEYTSSIKTINGLAKASVKTADGLAIASVKTINGLS